MTTPTIIRDIFSTNYLLSEKVKMDRIAKDLQRHYVLTKSDTDLFKTLKPTYCENVHSKVVALVGNIPGIETFTHPIYHDGTEYIDARPFVTKTGEVRMQNDYNFAVRRAILDLLWRETPNVFFLPELVNLMAKTFSDWIGNILSVNYLPDFRVLNTYKLLLMAHILAQTTSHTNMHESELESYMIKKARDVLRLPHEFVLSALDMYPSAFENIFKNPGRVYYLTNGLSKIYGEEDYITERSLYSMISSGATMLPNSAVLARLAIENLPTFVAMLYAVNTPNMKVTKLGGALYNNRNAFGDVLDKFITVNTSYKTVDAR
jgi:hypothetical protein